MFFRSLFLPGYLFLFALLIPLLLGLTLSLSQISHLIAREDVKLDQISTAVGANVSAVKTEGKRVVARLQSQWSMSTVHMLVVRVHIFWAGQNTCFFFLLTLSHPSRLSQIIFVVAVFLATYGTMKVFPR